MYQTIRRFLYQHGYMNSPIQKIWVLLQRPFVQRFHKNKIKYVHKKGELLLTEVYRITKGLNINCWVEFGTLLGAYRNQSFIPFDYDIDMGMYIEDYSDVFKMKMKDQGFKLVKCYYFVDARQNIKQLSEVTYKYKGIYFDIFLSRKGQHNRTVCVYTSCFDDTDTKYNVKQYYLDNFEPGNSVYINNIECISPSNPHKYLKSIYGDNYMTPVQGWVPPKCNPIVAFLPNNLYYGLLYRY